MQDRGARKDVVAALGAVAVVDDDGGERTRFRNVTVRNISTGGALLEIPFEEHEADQLPRVGERIQLTTSLLASPAVVAMVVWERTGKGPQVLGVRFRPLAEQDSGAVSAHVDDRRQALRQDADFQASLTIPDGPTWNAIVENISVTGALLTMEPVDVDPTELPPGTRVVFKCQYMFIEMMECHSTVAWVHQDEDEVQVGVCFEDLKDSDLGFIERFVG